MTGVVSIYSFSHREALCEHFVERNVGRLPEFRRKRCHRYRRERDKQACIISYLLLRQGLFEQYRIAEPGEFIFNGYGKPYLKDYPHIFFNFSHCERGIVCAIAEFEIGIDMQEIHPYDPGVAKLVCSADELCRLTESADPARLFCRIWTAKESYAKARGIGVAEVFKQETPEGLVRHREEEDAFIALCCERKKMDDIQIQWPKTCLNLSSFRNGGRQQKNDEKYSKK
ncbi:MAG: 4'-phosphopantetheinyl transferase superfamily protein [Clostridiales bacterium]|nr:4'-phosphopantetheinyl transferase superfamily protein [Clostridiales bacterium]